MLEILSNIFDFSSNMSKFSSKISEKVQIHKKIKSNLPIQTYDFERVLNFKKLHITRIFFLIFLIGREIIIEKNTNQCGKIPKYIQQKKTLKNRIIMGFKNSTIKMLDLSVMASAKC